MEPQQCVMQESEVISEKTSPCFDCNICLDFVCDPIVTLCGHLYCWPCIYKWIDTQRFSNNTPHCPVCKTEVSEKTIVPLYGRGQSLSEADNEGSKISTPPRPRVRFSRDTYENLNSFLPSSYSEYGEGSWLRSFNSTGEMVYARVFGNSTSLYTYPTSYHNVGSTSLRLRRREMEADKSLSRVSFFFFCVLIFCLLFF